MPNVSLIDGFRFFFYSNENNEPAHIHVSKADSDGKIWLEPGIAIAYMYGFSNAEQKNIMKIIKTNYQIFLNQWYEHFNK